MVLSRRLLLLAPLALSACGEDGPARSFPPLRYDYLPPLRLNVAKVEVADMPPPNALDGASPVPAAAALRQMVEDRVTADGSSGRAVIKIQEARINRSGNTLEGNFAVRVDVFTTDNTRSGFAEARAARTVTGIGRDLRGALYDMTKQLLDDMNVELEFQIRRSLRDYLQATSPGAVPTGVEQKNLSAPAASSGSAPGSGAARSASPRLTLGTPRAPVQGATPKR
ncbi:MAG: hypothetical protein ACRYGM_18530 [Janthinobacterium lividum]